MLDGWFETFTPTKGYVYLNTLATGAERSQAIYKEAQNLITSAHDNLKNTHIRTQSLSLLNGLWKHERQKESEFLQSYLKIPMGTSVSEIQTILKLFNQILQDEGILRDTLNKIQNFNPSERTKNDDTALYDLLNYVLPEAIKNCTQEILNQIQMGELKDDDIKQFTIQLQDNIKLTLLEKLQTGWKTTQDNPFKTLYDYLERTKGIDPLLDRIFEEYGITEAGLQQLIQMNKTLSTRDILKQKLPTRAKVKAGNIFEVITTTILGKFKEQVGSNKDVKIEVMHTGALNQMKADQMLIIGDVQIDTKPLINTFKDTIANVESVQLREQNRQGLQAMIQNIDQMHARLILISDKNYKLTGEALSKTGRFSGGFTAESPKLASLQETLANTNLRDHVQDIIFLLVNSGDDVINQRNVDDILDLLAVQIGSFLFDDVALQGELGKYQSNSNALHLFNLEGIYVPLSIFLEGAAQALSNLSEEQYVDYIKVSFHPSKTDLPEAGSTQEAWEKLYADRLLANSVHFQFFGDFINFIKANIPLN